MEDKEIRIVCTTADSLELDELTPFQGRFKLRSEKDINILADFIVQQGFSCPFFVWSHGGINLILDGHGRYLALEHLRHNGYKLPKLPVVLIEADDEKEARLKVLELNNVNGEFSKDVFLDYSRELALDYGQLHIPGIDLSDVQGAFKPSLDPVIATGEVSQDAVDAAEQRLNSYTAPPDNHDYRDVSCPHCHADFSVRVA